MDLRLVKVFLAASQEQNIQKLLSNYSYLETTSIFKSQQQLLIEILLEEERVETLLNDLKHKIPDLKDWQLSILSVEAKSTPTERTASESSKINKNSLYEKEIYHQISQSIRLDTVEVSLVVLATTIAAIGLVQNSQVVIIGAMVIAPLLKPNMALGVATTFGDLSLAIRTIKIGLTEILISLLLSIFFGILVPVNLEMNEIAIRTSVNFADVILAFASGVAGAISLTVGEQKAVVGVMVSVALLPPLVVLGMLIGSMLWESAIKTAVLVATNIVCLNLAAIATFWVKDIRPQQWWQKFQANRITKIATIFWSLVLALLIGVIFMFQFHKTNV